MFNSKTLNALFQCKNFPEIDKNFTTLHEYCTYQSRELDEHNIQPIELKDFIDTIINSKNIEILVNSINTIKKEFIYSSQTHGYLHTERVVLFSYFLALENGLNPRDIQLSLYAAMYHDIGRIHDGIDQYHGLHSAEKLEQLGLDIKPEDLTILKTIITCHSLPDEWFDSIVEECQILDYDRTKKLFNILKDADALDRVRLGCPHVALDFLRYDLTKSMIPLAYQIYNFYIINN